MGKMQRNKGSRIERELVHLHKGIGIPCQRVPLSGAAGGLAAGDLWIHLHPKDPTPAVAEVKARAHAQGWKNIKGWLGNNNLLFLREDQEKEPLVVMPWKEYVRIALILREE